MPRRPRLFKDNGYYHLIARANNKLFIFRRPRDFLYFKVLVRRSRQIHPWRLHHYCLMSNHIHLLASFGEGPWIPRIMQYLLQGYGRYFKKNQGYVGHLWQGRYKCLPIEKDSYLLQCAAYIERNPLRAKMVRDLASYPWSSYRFYSRAYRDPIISANAVYQLFGATDQERTRRYEEFVAMESPYDTNLDQELVESCF